MSLTACFLRAVNVGGRRVTNDELVAAVEAGGFTQVDAYQAAGNLVLDDRDLSPDDLTAAVEGAIAGAVGFTAEVVVRTGEELAACVDGVPWTDEQVAASTGKPNVVLLRREPSVDETAWLLSRATDANPLRLVGRDLHWLPTAGTGRAALDVAAIQTRLHPATTRTVGTLARLHARYF